MELPKDVKLQVSKVQSAESESPKATDKCTVYRQRKRLCLRLIRIEDRLIRIEDEA